jgi:hypothetical protein
MRLLAFDDGQEILFPHHQVVFAFDLDLGAGIFAEKNPVACFDLQSHALPLLAHLARAHGNDLAFDGFFFRGVRNDDAAFRDIHFFHPFDQNAVI